jgi:hypothetical protein
LIVPLSRLAANQDFEAIVFGDVDGDWSSAGAGGSADAQITDLGRAPRRPRRPPPMALRGDDRP